MPRRLPWLDGATEAKSVKTNKAPSSAAPKRGRHSSPDDLVDSDLDPIREDTPKPREKRRAARTPSTSPPPAPPDVEYMREGYDADDRYVMVEDEFLSTAKMFTQHLHHAEYVRFKRLAKSRGADALDGIRRPVDGKTEQRTELKIRLEGQENAKKIKTALGKVDGDDEGSEDEDPYMQDPHLARLMAAENAVTTHLASLPKVRTNTRAAAGLSQSPHNVERKRDVFAKSKDLPVLPTSSKVSKAFEEEYFSEDEEDDLDAQPKKSNRSAYTKAPETVRSFSSSGKSKHEPRDQKRVENSSIFKRFARDSSDSTVKAEKQREEPHIHNPREMKGSFATKHESTTVTNSTAASNYLAKRRADKEKKEREEKREAKSSIDVPTFAF